MVEEIIRPGVSTKLEEGAKGEVKLTVSCFGDDFVEIPKKTIEIFLQMKKEFKEKYDSNNNG